MRVDKKDKQAEYGSSRKAVCEVTPRQQREGEAKSAILCRLLCAKCATDFLVSLFVGFAVAAGSAQLNSGCLPDVLRTCKMGFRSRLHRSQSAQQPTTNVSLRGRAQWHMIGFSGGQSSARSKHLHEKARNCSARHRQIKTHTNTSKPRQKHQPTSILAFYRQALKPTKSGKRLR